VLFERFNYLAAFLFHNRFSKRRAQVKAPRHSHCQSLL